MGTITTGIGLISGINTAALIEALLSIEGRGRNTLQKRVVELTTAKTALMDVNARLLNFKNASSAFRSQSIFGSSFAVSSDETILTATTTTSALPGSYQFIVKQLVSNSQKLSRGFVDSDASPAGLSSLSFEFGQGRLGNDAELANLNGGDGVRRGKIVITDASGSGPVSVDLSDATTINEVLDAINNTSDLSVTASVEGDHLKITNVQTIANGTGSFTASDLGIAGTGDGSDEIAGTEINTVGLSTALSNLNDGNGVLVRNGVSDFALSFNGGASTFQIDLGRLDNPITTDTLLKDLNNGGGITTNNDGDEPDIKFVAKDGTEYEVDLDDLTNVGELISRVGNETNGDITLSITDGNKFTVTDNTAGGANTQVLGAGPNGTESAEDLGILNETGTTDPSFDGTLVLNADHQPRAVTMQDVVDRINNAVDELDVDNGGRIVASISDDGLGIKLTGVGGDVEVLAGSPAGGSTEYSDFVAAKTANDLGFQINQTGATVEGTRLIASLNSVLISSLNGGTGLSGNTALSINDRAGNFLNIVIDEDASLGDVIDQINSGGTNVTATLNDAGNGLLLTDTVGGGGNLTISGTAAAELGIEADVAEDSVRGSNIQLQYVSEGVRLKDLNYGRGVSSGSFRIYDGYGNTEVVSVGSDAKTLFDVINEINSRGLAVSARVNDTGDGLLLEHDPDNASPPQAGEPAVKIRVENVSGGAAKDLGVLGEADEVGENLDGSYERSIDFSTTDTLSEIVSAINAENIPVSASIVNTGTGPTPFRIQFAANISGTAGDLLIDDGGFGLDLNTVSEARDAKVFFGGSDPSNSFLITSTSNSLNDVIEGVTIDLLATSDTPVTLSVNRDTAAIVDAVDQFVVTFNDVIGRINDYDKFDVDTEERGPLLGNPTTARVRQALYRAVQGEAKGLDTQFTYLSHVGVKIGANGKLDFDKDKFKEAYTQDPQAVEALFAGFESSKNTTAEEIIDGVTVTDSEEVFTTLGFGELFNLLLDGLTNSLDGTVTLADKAMQDQIDLNNDRIEDFDQRLEAKRQRLQTEFTAMESALAILQGQSNALASIAGNVALAQNRLSFS